MVLIKLSLTYKSKVPLPPLKTLFVETVKFEMPLFTIGASNVPFLIVIAFPFKD